MSLYLDLEDSLYNVVNALYPTWRVIFAYGNGPEPETPYVCIDIQKLDACGREYNSTLGTYDGMGNIETVTLQDHKASVRFEFIGKADETMQVAEMAQELQVALRSVRGYQQQALNKLALHKTLHMRRVAVKRETDTYMVYQLDALYAFTSQIKDEHDYIDATGILGIYHDAGREPDHIIESEIQINYPT